jgi:hypothetical protein
MSPIDDCFFNEVRELHKIDIEYLDTDFPKENIFVRWLRETSSFARLMRNSVVLKNKTILSNWNFKPVGLWKKLFSLSNILFGSVFSVSYYIILKIEYLVKRCWSKKIVFKFEELLKEKEIETIFITHQRVAQVMPICIAARNLNITIVSVIYSWDNLPKARLNVFADKYLVWSDFMKYEMSLYYPEISSNSIVVTGTPQFEFYLNKDLLIDRHEFAITWGLDPCKKWILYSGGDILTSPFDYKYLEDVLLSILMNENIQLIFRRSPADFSNRFDKLIDEYRGKLFAIDPLCYKNDNWVFNIPLYADLKVLMNLTAHCELAINVGSTVAFDFVNFDKPTIYINYNRLNRGNWNINTINKFQHFRSMPSRDSVVWLNDVNEWENTINNILKYPNDMAKDRNIWYTKINKIDNLKASEKIANLLLI